ncbi:MAG: hypothetical protein V2L15_01880 [Desulfobacteraceae bacterium]|jgi:hypothetical protein|nr:hypothetical protein [Desulfobacteraceae bacterium]
MKPKTPIPDTPDAWLDEIVLAYRDAAEAIPFGPLVDHDLTEADLFHLGPTVCLKFRGLKLSAANLKRATDAALSSYVATSDLRDDLLASPQVAFAFCYIASHLGLGLIDETSASDILDYIVAHTDILVRRTGQE